MACSLRELLLQRAVPNNFLPQKIPLQCRKALGKQTLRLEYGCPEIKQVRSVYTNLRLTKTFQDLSTYPVDNFLGVVVPPTGIEPVSHA